MYINQPYDKNLGTELIEQISSNNYEQLTIMVAYAKLSGVNRILPTLKSFVENKGNIRCIIGIDQNNTSYEALNELMNISEKMYVFHSEDFSQTFHIKCYWLNSSDKLWYAIGSNNLTAGGLFSNYEMCSTNTLNDENALDAINKLEETFSKYVDSKECCIELNEDILCKLLENGYVFKEVDYKKAFGKAIRETKSNKRGTKSSPMFGKERFYAPALSSEKKEHKSKNISSVKTEIPSQDIIIPKDYLIRLVPKAGNRSKQVHFTKSLLENYFCLEAGDTVLMQEILPNGTPQEIEHRQVVLSQKNKNVKIELAGASILDDEYPTNEETRPVLIIKRINPSLFIYMVLLPNNQGYDKINEHLLEKPKGKALPDDLIDEETMISLWDKCPLI